MRERTKERVLYSVACSVAAVVLGLSHPQGALGAEGAGRDPCPSMAWEKLCLRYQDGVLARWRFERAVRAALEAASQTDREWNEFRESETLGTRRSEVDLTFALCAVLGAHERPGSGTPAHRRLHAYADEARACVWAGGSAP